MSKKSNDKGPTSVKVNVSKEPSRRSRIANPAACVFCVLTMVVVVPNLWA